MLQQQQQKKEKENKLHYMIGPLSSDWAEQ